MLLYRFVSFYLYIALFLVIVIINAAKTKKTESTIDKDVKEVEKDYSFDSINGISYS